MKSSQDIYKSVLYFYFWYWCDSISLNHHGKQNLLCCLCGLLTISFFPHVFLVSDLIIYFALFVFTATAQYVSASHLSCTCTVSSATSRHTSCSPKCRYHMEFPTLSNSLSKLTVPFQTRIPSSVLPPSLLPPDKHIISLYSTILLSLT